MVKNHNELTLTHAIICDDIRHEDNGKFILIGVYPGGIALTRMPDTLFVSLWLQFQIHITKETKLEVRMQGSVLKNNEIIFKPLTFTGEKILNEDIIAPVIYSRIKLEIESTGEIAIHYRYNNKRWKLASKIGIEYDEKNAQQINPV